MFNIPHKFKKNDRFEQFQILDFCGKGATGEVYLARTDDDQTCAIKIVDGISKEKLAQEAQSLQHYRDNIGKHPNLIEIDSVGYTADGILYYTMVAADNLSNESEGYRPDTLENRLAFFPPPDINTIYRWMNPILSGLDDLHQAGYYHRDLKPANILFVDGKPKIADVGLLIAKDHEETSPLAGTYGFIPPESFGATIRNLPQDGACDIYAAGIILYCLLSGMSPLDYPIIPENIPVEHIQKLRSIYLRACHPKPAQRFKNILEFRLALTDAFEKKAPSTSSFHIPPHLKTLFISNIVLCVLMIVAGSATRFFPTEQFVSYLSFVISLLCIITTVCDVILLGISNHWGKLAWFRVCCILHLVISISLFFMGV